MKKSTFFTSRESAKNLLNKFDFLINSDFIDEKISYEFVSHCRKNNYYEAYMTAIKKFDYHLLLFDESFFQFQLIEDKKNIVFR